SRGASANALFRNVLRFRQYLRRVWWPRAPFRPALRFLYMYVFRLGVLDGRVGWHLARLMVCYEYMISQLYRDKLHRLRTGELKPEDFLDPTPDHAPEPAEAAARR
ncbi:MAG: hypothetical protein KDA25_06615, partial [Phycisphaerales bacterium]|nr:hypothetical protein [Phycisphaerales bacterium]